MKKTLTLLLAIFLGLANTAIVFAQESDAPLSESSKPSYLRAVINTEDSVQIKKSTIFDASQSFIPDPSREILYEWDFGDGNKNQGIEVLHAFIDPKEYRVTLTIDDGVNKISTLKKVFAYKKMIVLITDVTEEKERIEQIQEDAKLQGIYIDVIDSFGTSTDFISEEILTQKVTERANEIEKADQIIIWTKESAGLNALSRYAQKNSVNEEDDTFDFSQTTIFVLEDSVSDKTDRISRTYSLLNPNKIVVFLEGALHPFIESKDDQTFIKTLENKGYEHQIIDQNTAKIKPWRFMSHFVNILINQGIPDNTIALLLLLPVIATVVAIMRQVVGITTYGIYTPSIITLTFIIIGIYAGLLTLITAIIIASIVRMILKRFRMLFIPKMAIVITIVSFFLFLLLISGIYLNLFDAQFLSIAIFPMLILSTLVEKFVSTKSGKGFSSAIILMTSTVLVSIIAYLIVGGEIDIGVTTLQIGAVEDAMLNYPEIIFLIIIFNFFIGKWTGLRIMERIKFREILRHTEE